MTIRTARESALCALLFFSISATVQAVPTTFTSRAAFDAAIGGLTSSVLDFESVSAGTVVPDGTAFGNVTLTYNRSALSVGLDMIVADQFVTTSGSNYLGVDDGFNQFFFNDDGVTMGFASPVHAVGLFIITPENAAFADDFILSAGGASVGNLSTPDFQLPTGDLFVPFDDVHFLGIVDLDASFVTASLTSLDPILGFVTFNLDDIVTASRDQGGPSGVPAPASLALLGLGLVLVAASRNRRARR